MPLILVDLVLQCRDLLALQWQHKLSVGQSHKQPDKVQKKRLQRGCFQSLFVFTLLRAKCSIEKLEYFRLRSVLSFTYF